MTIHELPITRPARADEGFIEALGINVIPVDGAITGTAPLLPSMWPTWSRRPRLALLASFVDVIAGHVPDAPRNPTVDLRIQVTDTVPETGVVRLVGEPLRVGRRLVVARTTIFDGDRPFATAVTTFVNRLMGPLNFGAENLPSDLESFEGLVNAQPVDDRTLEIEPTAPLANPAAGTVQGGVQAFLAELVAEHVTGSGHEAVDLDMRFLDRMEVGPLRAEADLVGHTGELGSVLVRVFDAGNDRTVSAATVLMAPREQAAGGAEGPAS